MSVRTVRGEMRTWSDLDHRADAAPVLAALVDDAVAPSQHGLVVGPHTTDVVAAVAARCARTTVLVRSVADAERLARAAPASCEVVAGGLDGLAEHPTEDVDLLVALDGLDRVLGTDGPDLDWPARLDLLTSLGRPGSRLLLTLENEASVAALLDRRPADDRHGDEEWVPVHDDPRRPVAVDALRAAVGDEQAPVLALSSSAAPSAAVDVDQAASGRRSWAVRALEAAIARDSDPDVLLAPVTRPLDRLVRAGRLPDVAPAWLVVTGVGPEAPGAVALAGTGPDVLLGAWSSEGWRVVAGDVTLDVPDGDTVEDRLCRLAAREDVPAIRALAAGLAGAGPAAPWEDAVLGADGDAHAGSPSAGEIDVTAAWVRFADRLLAGGHRHPWPPWMGVDELAATLAEMSGAASDPEAIRAARAAATALAEARGEPAPGTPRPARTPQEALVAAEAAERRVVELEGVVQGLERTLRMRDRSLRRRDRRIESLRGQVAARGPVGRARAAVGRVVRTVRRGPRGR